MKQSHPSYGVVQLNRVITPAGTKMVGCHFPEPVYYELCIYGALYEEHVEMMEQRFRADLDNLIIRICLSEQQMIQLLLHSNRYEFVPCTIDRLHGEQVAPAKSLSIIDRDKHINAIKQCMRDRYNRSMQKITELRKKLNNARLSNRQRQTIDILLSQIRGDIEWDIPFYLQQYEKFLNDLLNEKSFKEQQKEKPKKTRRRS